MSPGEVSGFNCSVDMKTRVTQGIFKEMALVVGEWIQAPCVISQFLQV